jgi:hypothetical protein
LIKCWADYLPGGSFCRLFDQIVEMPRDWRDAVGVMVVGLSVFSRQYE